MALGTGASYRGGHIVRNSPACSDAVALLCYSGRADIRGADATSAGPDSPQRRACCASRPQKMSRSRELRTVLTWLSCRAVRTSRFDQRRIVLASTWQRRASDICHPRAPKASMARALSCLPLMLTNEPKDLFREAVDADPRTVADAVLSRGHVNHIATPLGASNRIV